MYFEGINPIKITVRVLIQIWKRIVEIKGKFNYKMYKRQLSINEKVVKRLKNEQDSLENVKKRLHLAYSELNVRKATIEKLREDIAKLENKNKTTERTLLEERIKNEALAEEIKELSLKV